jgi:hypothetical protein
VVIFATKAPHDKLWAGSDTKIFWKLGFGGFFCGYHRNAVLSAIHLKTSLSLGVFAREIDPHAAAGTPSKFGAGTHPSSLAFAQIPASVLAPC